MKLLDHQFFFSIFALEAGLKCTYKNIEDCNPRRKTLHELIDWATEKVSWKIQKMNTMN